MDHIFYSDFSNLLSDYKNPTTKEEKLIKNKLDSIVALYDACDDDERAFADEITVEFSRIVAILKNQYKKEILDLTTKIDELNAQGGSGISYVTPKMANDSPYEYDREVLEAFYNHFKGDYPLSYWEVECHRYDDNEDRKAKVNLTIWDYVNRIRTFANKYLYEIYPEDSIPTVIHGEDADEYETFEPIVFIYNNLELILAKMKTTNENGETVKQRLNIRSALRKLNEFKQQER